MTDFNTTATEDKTLPVVVYVLYFLGLFHGLTMIIGLIIAYASRDNAGPRMASHYTWLIRTFWVGIGAFVAGSLLLMVGIPLSFILIGIPMVALGGFLMAVAWVWCAVRLVLGAIYLSRDEAYPRPYAVIA
ncbi:MAG: hypothetical protein E7812_03475 [Phenylobacterium sp.]|nr:MAG: hypothetical protein E7812_03475 [Phenylobacterium sp.]